MMKYWIRTEIEQELGGYSRRKAAGGHVKRRKKTAGDQAHGSFVHLCYDELMNVW